ncbi:phospholipase D family protein [Sphingomonas sp. PL-96]|uniref:phospholipase D family protein n=1 Tax=Sphingomonas sp. PL-96 TaxID=2887201 RepID=UPI001E3D7C32|nr:phospholipase D family protein [Sphingomonas sp. PL-96]MCC2976073.1 phospholipase D family protein [Sphingomonas sp. PL-96]
MKRGWTGWIAAGAVAAGLWWLNRLPANVSQPAPKDVGDTADTALGRGVARERAANPNLSGIQLLADAREAFAARVALARAAERSLDLQYYIWHGDRSGTLMLEAVHAAAERGVRVRLLLDDNGISGLDTALAALDLHPNVEVRLFNPFRIRWPKPIGYLTEFTRLNRRMHNKSFTADNSVTIVGGRNIGDEYFGAADGGLFADLDALAIGPIVADVSADFERYWCCGSAYPAAEILPPVRERQRRRLHKRASIVERDPSARRYVQALRDLPLVHRLIEGHLPLTWAEVRMISDDPAKALGRARKRDLLSDRLRAVLETSERELGLISSYFVPGKRGCAEFSRLAKQGVSVSVLTNAYEATDVGVVHAGYAPYRKRLLEAGVRLFEMRREARDAPRRRERRRGVRLGVASNFRGSGTGSTAALRSGASTLHAKTFTVDRERLFIGSFNLDPRSIALNTELGFLIESPELAGQVADVFADQVAHLAYEVRLDEAGELVWAEQDDAGERIHHREPGLGPIPQLALRAVARLPIEWLL